MKQIKVLVHKFGKWYCEKTSELEFQAQKFIRKNERPIEYGFVFKKLLDVNPSSILDVGSGMTAFPHLLRNCGFHVTSIDNRGEYWKAGMFNRHYHVINDDITNPRLEHTFDFITCISVLEHIREHREAIKGMFSLLNSNGYLALTFPYNEQTYIDNVYASPDAMYGKGKSYICQAFSRSQINEWLNQNGGELVSQEYWKFFTGDYWTFGEQLSRPVLVDENSLHQLTCILIKKKS